MPAGPNTTARVGGAPGGTDHVNVTQANAGALAAANGLTASGAPGNTMRVDTNVFFGQPAPLSPPATPQMALNGQGPGSSDVLTLDALAPVLAVAIEHWTTAGATAAQLAQMQNAQIRIADLPDAGFLANTDQHGITSDGNAAGWGWFVDPTPGDNGEFRATAVPGQLAATGGSAAGHIDLLTVVEHELGHVVGMADTTGPGIMSAALDIGERRLPTSSVSADPTVPPAQTADSAPTVAPGQAAPAASGNPDKTAVDARHEGGSHGADAFVFAHHDHGMAIPPMAHVHAKGDRFDFSALPSQFHAAGADDGMIGGAIGDRDGKFAALADDITPDMHDATHWAHGGHFEGTHHGEANHLAQIHVGLLA